MNLRALPPLVLSVAFASVARAYVLIDDFTVGGFTKRLTGEDSYTHIERGLDQNHCALRYRQLYTNINSNPNGGVMDISVGGGAQMVNCSRELCWEQTLLLGEAQQVQLDLSREEEICVDLTTVPEFSLADNWLMVVSDVDGQSAGNGAWLFRPEGIRFRKRSFSRQIDWSRVTAIQFTQDWDNFPNPLTYSVSKIYAVPEPATMGAFLVIFAAAARRARTARLSMPQPAKG